MMSSASLTHTNGWQRWFQPSTKRRIEATRSPTLGKLPRRIAWRVMIAKNTSTRFIQLAEVGVTCRWTLGCLASQALIVAWVWVPSLSSTRCSCRRGQALATSLRKARNSAWRCRSKHWSVTRPVATSNAANRVVVPCRTSSWVRRWGLPGRSGRLGAVRESAWIWRFSSTQTTMARSGGCRLQVQADDVADLGVQLGVGGELERLGPPGLEVMLAPHAGHGVVADPQLVGQQPGRPVGDPQVLGWRGQRGGQDLGAPLGADGLGPARAGLVV